MLKFYTLFSDILLKTRKLSKTSQKNKYQNTVLLKMFSMTVRIHFWHQSGMSLPNLLRNFAQLPEKIVCFFPLVKDCSNCFWTRRMQIWQLGLQLLAEAQNALARKQKKSKPQVLRWKSSFTWFLDTYIAHMHLCLKKFRRRPQKNSTNNRKRYWQSDSEKKQQLFSLSC